MRLPVAIALLLAYTTLQAPELRWKVHYSLHGEHDAIVPAESSAQARREVISMFPGAVVTGVSRVK